MADITYIRTQRGWLYLAAVLDLYSRKVVGRACRRSRNASLATARGSSFVRFDGCYIRVTHCGSIPKTPAPAAPIIAVMVTHDAIL